MQAINELWLQNPVVWSIVLPFAFHQVLFWGWSALLVLLDRFEVPKALFKYKLQPVRSERLFRLIY
jgi:hypothetical protein